MVRQLSPPATPDSSVMLHNRECRVCRREACLLLQLLFDLIEIAWHSGFLSRTSTGTTQTCQIYARDLPVHFGTVRSLDQSVERTSKKSANLACVEESCGRRILACFFGIEASALKDTRNCGGNAARKQPENPCIRMHAWHHMESRMP